MSHFVSEAKDELDGILRLEQIRSFAAVDPTDKLALVSMLIPCAKVAPQAPPAAPASRRVQDPAHVPQQTQRPHARCVPCAIRAPANTSSTLGSSSSPAASCHRSPQHRRHRTSSPSPDPRTRARVPGTPHARGAPGGCMPARSIPLGCAGLRERRSALLGVDERLDRHAVGEVEVEGRQTRAGPPAAWCRRGRTTPAPAVQARVNTPDESLPSSVCGQ
jgi:hypothetical protein